MVANAISDGGKFGSIWLHNYYRSQLARGRVQNSNGTYLPTGQNVYALVSKVATFLTLSVGEEIVIFFITLTTPPRVLSSME